MEKIKCPICDVFSENVIIQENGYEYKSCPECGLVYVSPRPPEHEIYELYDDYREDRRGEFVDKLGDRLVVAKETLRHIKREQSSGSLLEIGAGTGTFLDEARSAGFDVYGTELDGGAARYIRENRGIPCKEEPVSESLYGSRQFDVIYHRNVLSHLYNPINDLKSMNRLLKEDGILVFETGNLPDVDEKYYSDYPSFGLPDHLFTFGDESFRKGLRESGFEILYKQRYNILPWLRFKQAIAPVRTGVVGTINSTSASPTGADDGRKADSTPASAAYRLLFRGWDLTKALMKYKLGKIVARRDQPHTLIITAKKV